MVHYDSDYEVRLATLAALGGDATKHYHSVYDIDIAILEVIEEGGGGEGMTWNQIQDKLATSGVNEITFTNGSESAILDYATLKELIEGGGGGAGIDDDIISTETTWSSSKINSLVGDINSTPEEIIGVNNLNSKLREIYGD